MTDYHPRWKRYLSPRFVLGKVREQGVVWCARVLLAKIYGKIYGRLRRYPSLPTILKNARAVMWPSAAYTDSVLAIYDFKASPYTFDFMQFLANCETYRVQNSLSYIDVVIVVDREKHHRGDQPEVTESNYRNWILNLAECTDLVRSASSLSIFDDEHKFLPFYQRARRMHRVFPNIGNPVVYEPRAEYGMRRVADFFYRTGYVPRFESSGVLLEWAERYFLENSYLLLPVVVFVRNSKSHPWRNTKWAEWLKFFETVRHEYPVKFFVINDFWNPVVLPERHRENAQICIEATISHKYRAALMQRATLIMGQAVGPFFSTAPFIDTPFLMFGFDSAFAHRSLESHMEFHGLTEDGQFPWLNKYQKMIGKGDAETILARFAEMYALLEDEQRLILDYWPSPAPTAQTQPEQLSD